MRNQVDSGDHEKSSNILTSIRESVIHSHRQFYRIYRSLRRAELEPRQICFAQIRDQSNCRASCATSHTRNVVSTGSAWTSRTLVGKGHGVFLVRQKCARPTTRWRDTSSTSVQFTIWWADHSIWSWDKHFTHRQKTMIECSRSVQQSFLGSCRLCHRPVLF